MVLPTKLTTKPTTKLTKPTTKLTKPTKRKTTRTTIIFLISCRLRNAFALFNTKKYNRKNKTEKTQ